MKPKIALPVAALLALVGCTLTRSQVRDDDKVPSLDRAGGYLITPRRCSLRVMTVSRPAGDPIVNEIVWRGSDPQCVPDDVRHAWEANGLRIGRVTGDLPAEVRELLDAPAPQKVDPATYIQASGESSLIAVGPQADKVSLFLNLKDDKLVGRDYADALPFVRLTPTYGESGGVSLRFVPEIHHGAVRQGWAPAPGGNFSGNDFTVKVGQQEETLRDLGADLTLRPGQFAVIGALPDRPSSLGEFLFAEPEKSSNRPVQKVVLVWAGRVDPEPDRPVPDDLRPVDPPEMPRASALQGEDKGQAEAKD